MDQRRSITISIVLTMGGLFVFQCLFFTILALRIALRAKVGIFFFCTSFVYNTVLVILLLQRRDLFQIEPEGRKLTRVNLANFLTMTRLTSLPTICFMIYLSRSFSILPVLVVFTSIIFLTDMFDGVLSRLTHQITKIGKQMDSFSDYLVLMVISIAFIVYEMIPVWFFVGVFVRGAVMVVGMSVVTHRRGYLKPDTSFIGKASFFAIMVLYAFEMFTLVPTGWLWTRLVARILEYVVGAILLVSIADKLIYFSNELKSLERK